MGKIEFDKKRKLDMICIGRITIDFNPAYTDIVQEAFGPLKNVSYFQMFLGGSPANTALGMRKHGLKVGFIGKISDDQFGDFAEEIFAEKGIDTSHLKRCTGGENMGLTFTEMLHPGKTNLLMYRNKIADLQLTMEEIDEDYIKSAKAILVSGTALAESPSREATLKAVALAKKTNTKVIFDIDYRPYNWTSLDEVSVYCAQVAKDADVIMGSREEFDDTERLLRPGMDDASSAAFWENYGSKILVIKHGMEGSAAFSGGKRYAIKPFPVEARKGTGGGDGYASAFLYGLLQGWDIKQCLEFGSAEASMMVRSNNCSNDLPTTEEVAAFIKEEKERYGEMIAEA